MPGFLGTRGSFMLDFVVVAMAAIVPVMLLSANLVRNKKQYLLHKRIQLTLAALLLLAVVAFEVEIRISGWTHLAETSRFWRDGRLNDWVDWSLLIHLCFAIPTPFIWGLVIFRGWRKFPNPPSPMEHSRWHRRWGKIAMLMMAGTAATGWVFYYLAFTA